MEENVRYKDIQRQQNRGDKSYHLPRLHISGDTYAETSIKIDPVSLQGSLNFGRFPADLLLSYLFGGVFRERLAQFFKIANQDILLLFTYFIFRRD
ncbi:MAG: hypothetical protein JWQ87_3626 [Candidatus Sulfotelmatobacter sp.]|nr:hypothetical protein [Candidatus Sulfotelmatobacter sp.]